MADFFISFHGHEYQNQGEGKRLFYTNVIFKLCQYFKNLIPIISGVYADGIKQMVQ